jgi:hypothetical protein
MDEGYSRTKASLLDMTTSLAISPSILAVGETSSGFYDG